jgi:hypothetical protein
MVTTRGGHAKKILGSELDDDDGDNHGMYLGSHPTTPRVDIQNRHQHIPPVGNYRLR